MVYFSVEIYKRGVNPFLIGEEIRKGLILASIEGNEMG